MEYVLNIVFSPDKENVLMVLKNRPAFLANLYNFVGGKLESHDENPESAAFRETLEESGINTNPEYFQHEDLRFWSPLLKLNFKILAPIP